MRTQAQPFSTREISCRNGEKNIWGVAYLPEPAQEPLPLVIFSHELGSTHKTGIGYAELLAGAGIAVYCFDFCGGTVGEGNRSDGTNAGMSVMTEVSDLEAVLDAAKTWAFVDPARIVLMGASQGGTVTALAGCRRSSEITAMVLLYPALNIISDLRQGFGSPERVPPAFDMFRGWIRVSRRYALDVWDTDVFAELAGYPAPVLLLHGDSDRAVRLCWSEQAAKTIPNCEFHVIPGGAHGFTDKPFREAAAFVLRFVRELTAEKTN